MRPFKETKIADSKEMKTSFLCSNEVLYAKPQLEMFLGEYNTLLASILSENAQSLSYIASPVVNRMEAQTHFYEKIEKYIQLQEMLKKNEGLGVIIAQEDEFIFEALKKEFKSRIRMEEADTGIFLSVLNLLKRINILRFTIKFVIVLWRELNLISAAKMMSPVKNRYQSVIRTYFDSRCRGSDGRLREEYFGPFFDDLVKHEKVLAVYKLLHYKELGSFLELRSKENDFESCLLEHFLSPSSLLRAMAKFSLGRIKLRNKCLYRGKDISSLLQKMADREFYSLKGIDVFIEYEVAKNILRLNPGRLYFPYENQTWEKVYPLAKNEMQAHHTRIIGFQHTSLSYKLIMHFPARVEKDLPLFPDKILTVGKIYRQLLEEKAHFPCEITEGAALRHSKYTKGNDFLIKMPHRELRKKVAYAFSYDLLRYKNILLALLDVFRESGITVYLKMHPDYLEDRVLKSLHIDLPGNFILAQKIPWTAVYDDVDCILYDDNTIGVEGLINGVKTFMLEIVEPIYDVDRMPGFSAWKNSVDMEGLKKLKEEIEDSIFEPWYDTKMVKEYVDSYFNVYSKERYFEAYL